MIDFDPGLRGLMESMGTSPLTTAAEAQDSQVEDNKGSKVSRDQTDQDGLTGVDRLGACEAEGRSFISWWSNHNGEKGEKRKKG